MPCVGFNANGLQTAIVSTASVAVPMAISSALSAAISGANSPGVTRFSLDGSKKQTGAAAAPGGRGWNAWFSLAENRVGYSYQPLQSSGKVDLVLAGLDYTFANNVIAGVAASWDRTRVGTSFNGGNLSGNGYMVAPYVAMALTRSWLLDASIGFGRASLDQTDNSVVGGITGSTKDRRTFGALSLSYNYVSGNLMLTGKGSYLYAEDRLDAFTLSNNTFIAGNTGRLGQVRIGGQAAYNAGSVQPYFGLYYFRDTQRADQAALGGTSAANDKDGVTVQAGLNFYSRGPVYGGIMVSSDQGRSQVKNDQFMANIGIRF